MRIFNLPDLGEGLPDAEIVKWLIQEGDVLSIDQPMAEMETAKSVVEVPSPFEGRVDKLHGKEGDIIPTGSPLVTFSNEEGVDETKNHPSAQHDSSAVVGTMQTSNTIQTENLIKNDGIPASAPVRALARKLKLDLSTVISTGNDGRITLQDVRNAHKTRNEPSNTSQQYSAIPASPKVRATAKERGVNISQAKTSGHLGNVTLSDVETAALDTQNPNLSGYQLTFNEKGEPLRSTRRAMAVAMEHARSTIMNTTIYDDADISTWQGENDITMRVVRAIIIACQTVPALNAWFNGQSLQRVIHQHVNIGIAVDSPHGLFVPVIKNVHDKPKSIIRQEFNKKRDAIMDRSIKSDDLTGGTITLSNYGTIAGRYATPIVIPPQVAILGTGHISDDVKMTDDGIKAVKHIPLSLSFDHRCVTGGEAARFLAALITDLKCAE